MVKSGVGKGDKMIRKLLIANRGEIAVRIAKTAAEMDIATVAIHPADDLASLHVREADEAVALVGSGTAAYLAGEAIVAAALERGCDAIHPGYGFLAENAGFAQACADAGVVFVGPTAQTLALFGDKCAARGHAEACGVAILPGTLGATSFDEARANPSFSARKP